MGHDFPRQEFESRIEPQELEGSWRVLGRCRDCGQFWLLDQWDKYASELAIKIPDPKCWTTDDERAARIAYLRRSRGGDEPTAECIVSNCDRRPLRGIVYCAEHAFELTGAWA